MKTSFILFILILGVLAPAQSQGWQVANSGTSEWLLSLSFPSANTGYACGWSGTILKTTDGGSSWNKQTTGTLNVLHSIDFINETNGYAVGEYGTVLKTQDGGAHWTNISPGIAFALLSVDFPNELTGFAGGGVFMCTSDGGSTWPCYDSLGTDWFNCIRFRDAEKGFATSNLGNIYRTLDGGENWTIVGHSSGRLNSICFADDLTGYAAGEDADNKGVILKTTDGGSSWINYLFPSSQAFSDVTFPIKDTGYVVGGNGEIMKTTDGGIHWTGQNYSTPQWLNAVCFTDAGHGIIAGTGGLILKTASGGVLGVENSVAVLPRVKIWPNPAFDHMTVTTKAGTENSIRYEVEDLQGSLLIRGNTTPNDIRIDISSLSPGLFLLRLYTREGVITGKFVKSGNIKKE